MMVGCTGVGSPALDRLVERLARLGLDGDHAHGVSPIAVWMPEISPPPPTGTMTASASGASSSISSPTVPAPAITSGSSNGMDERAACLCDAARARRSNASPGFVASRSTVRAVAARRFDLLLGRALPHHDERVDVLFGGGERDGLRVVAGADRDHAALLLVGGEDC